MKAILLSLASVALLSGCASTGGSGNPLPPSAATVLQAASSLRPPSDGYLQVSRTDQARWNRGVSLTWSIAIPGAPATLSLTDFPAKGTVRFADGKSTSIRGIAKALAVACEEPEVEAWLAMDGRLMIAVSSCYTAEVSEGIFSIRDGKSDQYLTQEASTLGDRSVKISRSFHSANGDVIAASTEIEGSPGSRDFLKDWEKVR
jgi:hypothetical protein